MMNRFALLLPLVMLVACDRQDQGTAVQIGSKGNGTAITIDTPGFKADVNLPIFDKLASQMDIDGVQFFPGSKVSGINVDGKGAGGGQVAMRFQAPAPRAKVADWFRGQFAANGFEARSTPTGFAGTKRDGDWFTLDLTEANGATAGEFKLGKAQQ